MTALRLAFSLGFGTLRTRPTLSILAVCLLALGTVALGGLFGSIYLLRGLENEFISGLNLEIELTAGLPEFQRTDIMSRAEQWPGAEFVQFVPPELTLEEIQKETGEDLRQLFGMNPFPPMIRVRFNATSQTTLDSLVFAARRWSGVNAVAYPKKLWSEINGLLDRLTGQLGYAAALLSLVSMVLVGLCLRAQVRNRTESWDFLSLFGMSTATFNLALFAQELIVGFIGGLLACLILLFLTAGYSWLFLRPLALPFWFYACIWMMAMVLAILAGLFSPRRMTV